MSRNRIKLKRTTNPVDLWKYFLPSTAGVSSLGLVWLLLRLYNSWKEKRQSKLFSVEQAYVSQNSEKNGLTEDDFDVCVVGAGPSDKENFPRDKICGDTLHPLAQHHLKNMGILRSILEDEAVVKFASTRGFVSPNGSNFIDTVSSSSSNDVMVIQRTILDHKIVIAAQEAGVSFKEKSQVQFLQYDDDLAVWNLRVSQGDDLDKEDLIVNAKCVVVADGAESYIARYLKLIDSTPNGAGGRSFVKAKTHQCRAHEVVFYPKKILPGHFHVIHEIGDFLNLSCFSIDSDNRLHPQQINEVYDELMDSDPNIVKTLGPHPTISQFQIAPVRVGGIKKSFGKAVLILGDAAGQVDPLTGHGIHLGMEAAHIASCTILEAFKLKDFSENQFMKYHEKWTKQWKWDFYWSYFILNLSKDHPRLVDAAATVIQRKGPPAILLWALVISGVRPKWHIISWFMRPDVFVLTLYYLFKLWVHDHFF